jgi:hypothetical protein
MDLEKSWNDKGPEEQGWDDLVKQSLSKKREPLDPLHKLRKSLRLNIGYAILICLLYIAAMIYFTLPIFRISMFLMLGFTAWGFITALREYKSIEPGISTNHSLLEDMERHFHSISHWIKTQEKVALFFYPIGALGGFIMGGVIGSGKTVNEFMSKPFVIITLIIILIVLIPACYYLAKWMNKKAFGDHLDQLKENIDQLKNG